MLIARADSRIVDRPLYEPAMPWLKPRYGSKAEAHGGSGSLPLAVLR